MNRLSDEWFSSKSESVPLWHKIALSIDEMYVYLSLVIILSVSSSKASSNCLISFSIE